MARCINSVLEKYIGNYVLQYADDTAKEQLSR